jgi:AcrR family transcriptional regulator
VLAGVEGDHGELLRNHLVDIAERLLSDRTVTAITTRDLARAAEVSEGVLYNYFADKNELLLTALVRRFRELVANLLTGLPEAGEAPLQTNLERLANGLLELQLAGLPLFGKLLSEPALLARFSRAIHASDVELSGVEIRAATVEYLAAEQARGRIGDCDLEAAADLLLGATAQVALLHIVAATPAAERIPALVRTLTGGLLPTEGTT